MFHTAQEAVQEVDAPKDTDGGRELLSFGEQYMVCFFWPEHYMYISSKNWPMMDPSVSFHLQKKT